MALDLTPEQKTVGKTNFNRAVGSLAEADAAHGGGITRRRFMKGLIAAGAVAPVAAATYFGYGDAIFGGGGHRPVRAGLIGGGDEGGVLVGEHNPKYLQFIAYSDIRKSNQERIFTGEPTGPRRGFNSHYGNDAKRHIRLYEDYRELLRNPEIEAVVIALPLNLHAPVAMEAMRAGKHVLCEKLMAWNVSQCKDMIRVANETNRVLAIGHQRHYSMLYAHASEVIDSGILGDIRHIRALWHRNMTLPRLDKDNKPVFEEVRIDGRTVRLPAYKDSWRPAIKPEDHLSLERVRQAGFKSLEELIRWRLYRRTGGGLMVELGAHQLDACSIFLGKVHPLAVSGVGAKIFYHDDREIDDHVFCTFEFPGKHYWAEGGTRVNDPSDKIIVTYSSISTNNFEPYGECVMGTRGTLVVEEEKTAMLYGGSNVNRATAVSVTTTGAGAPSLTSSPSDNPALNRAAETGQTALGPPSRGYKEEMEHLAYVIRMRDQGTSRDRAHLQVRCPGPAAMADAIIALTANQAMRHHRRIEFKPEWFDPASSAVPDEDMVVERV